MHVVVREGRQNDRNNQTVQTESLSENEDQDHAHVDVLLGVCAHASVTSDADGKTSGEGGEPTAEAGGEVAVAVVAGVSPLTEGDVVDGGLLDCTQRNAISGEPSTYLCPAE